MASSEAGRGPIASEEPRHRMAPGLGVIQWQGRILVYQMSGDTLSWARFLGDQPAEINPELLAAIQADRAKLQGAA